MKDTFGNPVELTVPEGPGGFVGGTLVHTREGPRPIETIKAGDVVLAKAEGGSGEPAFKRVVRTQAHEDRDVFFLLHEILEGNAYRSEYLVGAGGLRLWVSRQTDDYENPPEVDDVSAWLAVFEVWERAHFRMRHESRMPMKSEVERRDGRIGVLTSQDPIMLTATPDVGISFDANEYWYSDGAEGVAVRFTAAGPEARRSPQGTYESMYIGLDEDLYEHLDENDIVYRSGGFHPVRRKVFDLEIEDGYGFYAGAEGVLVRGGAAPA